MWLIGTQIWHTGAVGDEGETMIICKIVPFRLIVLEAKSRVEVRCVCLNYTIKCACVAPQRSACASGPVPHCQRDQRGRESPSGTRCVTFAVVGRTFRVVITQLRHSVCLRRLISTGTRVLLRRPTVFIIESAVYGTKISRKVRRECCAVLSQKLWTFRTVCLFIVECSYDVATAQEMTC